MQITIRQAAGYLGVSESELRTWVKERGLPAHRVNERLLLNAIEVWQWAMENGIPASRALLDVARRSPEETPPISQLIEAGGIHRDVEGENKSEVLAAVVKRLPASPDLDRDFLLDVLDAREAMGSTGIGDGIAIPHVRNPILLHVDQPYVTLCLLRRPVEFDAIDNKPVHAVFLVISTSVPSHLRILAQLAFVLRDQELRHLLRDRAESSRILARIREIERLTTGSYPAVPKAGR